ncbi:MAG: Asp-tRNA(Asn)/Glu-tRNA(Gln) amidotransferase A subunit family amidase [Porticoccaceae bacterium]|jgi:Asp-tRNA(Asn)/Glu-tRNA(Gln) amidotransferase A subunit family amidase
MDVIGPHVKNVRDAATMVDVIAGHTDADSKTKAAIGNLSEQGYMAEAGQNDQSQVKHEYCIKSH